LPDPPWREGRRRAEAVCRQPWRPAPRRPTFPRHRLMRPRHRRRPARVIPTPDPNPRASPNKARLVRAR
jgi:hypothetical protein